MDNGGVQGRCGGLKRRMWMTKGGEGRVWMAEGMSRKGVELRGRGERCGPLTKVGRRYGWRRDGAMAISPLRTSNEGRQRGVASPRLPHNPPSVVVCPAARVQGPGRQAAGPPLTPRLPGCSSSASTGSRCTSPRCRRPGRPPRPALRWAAAGCS